MKATSPRHFGWYKAVLNILWLTALIMVVGSLITLVTPIRHLWRSSLLIGRTELIKTGNYGDEYVLRLHSAYPEPQTNTRSQLPMRPLRRPPYVEQELANCGRIDISITEGAANNLRLPFALMGLLASTTLCYMLWLITQILFSVKRGSPFNRLNASRVGVIAWMLCIAPIPCRLVGMILEFYIESIFQVHFSNRLGLLPFDYACLLVGLVMAILAYVMKQGVVLMEEQELTV